MSNPNSTSTAGPPPTLSDPPSPSTSAPPSSTADPDPSTVPTTSPEPSSSDPQTSLTPTTDLPTSEPPIPTPSTSDVPTMEPTTERTTEPTTEPTSEPSSTTPPPTTTPPPSSSQEVIVSTIIESSSDRPPVVIIVTTSAQPTPNTLTTSSASSSTSSSAASLENNKNEGGGGLTGAGRTAVAVVVPIVAVAIIALAALWFWRRRKQRKDAEELRRKEVEEYGFNPNADPTLPAVGIVGGATAGGGGYEMREEGNGYRGWGSTTAGTSTGRKASTQLSGGVAAGRAYSDGTSPSQGAAVSDARSGDPLVNGTTNGRPNSGDAEPMGAMGPATASNVHRGASNASSSYSAANHSDASGEQAIPGGAYGAAQYYSTDGPYGGPAEMAGQPVIRDNLARRATRIENPSHFPTQASAGISQNF